MALPKTASARARRNRVAGARTLSTSASSPAAPPLPPLDDDEAWHEQTLAWWADVWASPMAPEYDDSDLHGLVLLARLVDASWRASSSTALKDLMGEIRLQRQCFGLSPIDRRRLQWEIERGEEATAKSQKRRAISPPPKRGADPRSVLRAV